TQQTVDSLTPELRARCRPLYPMKIRGKSDEVMVCDVVWRGDADLTETFRRPGDVASQWNLKLAYGGSMFTIEPAGTVRLARRQDDHVELIASENYVSPAVLIAHGTQLTNKYAEGYPGKRYYGGCEYVDMVETIALERAKKLFGAPWANVQPHSGSQANQAVYAAALRPGDTLLGMSLAHGGHLTHGSTVNYSGKLYKVISYGLGENEEIDYAQ